jgi:hypothetical protein
VGAPRRLEAASARWRAPGVETAAAILAADEAFAPLYGNEISADVRSGPLPGRDLNPAVSTTYSVAGVRPRPGTIEAVLPGVIDPPVTPEERLADAMSAFGLLCDRAIEYLDLLGWEDTPKAESSSANG